MIPFNYHHLYYFYVTAKEGSVSKACEKLRLAQPTVSTQVRQFENSWGRPLFERKRQRLVLTEDGKMVLDYAERIFELGRELSDTLHDQPVGGRLSVEVGVQHGTPRGFSHALVLSVLQYDRTAHVAIREGNLDDLLADLNQQQLDLLLTNLPVQSVVEGEYTNRLIGKVPLVFVASPQLARRHARVPRDLHGAPFILPLAPSQIHQQIQDFFAAHKIIPQIMAEVQDVEVARRLAISGVGIAPLNAFTVANSAPPRALAILGQRRLPAIHETLYLVTRRRRRPNPLAKHLEERFHIPEDVWRGLRIRTLRSASSS